MANVPNTRPSVKHHRWMLVTMTPVEILGVDAEGNPSFFRTGEESEERVICPDCGLGLNHPDMMHTACAAESEVELNLGDYDEDDGDELGGG